MTSEERAQPERFDRRALLRRAGQGSLAVAFAAGLASCSSGSSDGGGDEASTTGPGPSGTTAASSSRSIRRTATPSGGTSSVLPTHTKFAGVEPDIPAGNANAIDGFFNYPDPPIDAVPDKPLSGGTVTAVAHLSIVAPQPMAKNNWWKNINDELGGTFDLTMVPSADYARKFATMIAGGDLPELCQVPDIANVDQVLKADFTDLTEFLAGDAVNDYPMLANFSTTTWKGALYNGGIYGVPFPLLPLVSRMEVRTDITDKLGLTVKAESADDFLSLCKAVTDPKQQRWAMVQPTTSKFVQEMCGVPNDWAVADGKFTKDIETDEYKEWLSYVKGMWDQGLIHPDAFSNPAVAPLFQGGHFVFFQVGGAGFTSAMPIYTNSAPGLKVMPLAPPKFDGGGLAPTYLGNGHGNITAIRKKGVSASRVRELLAVLNVLAGPFGTTQYLATNFGAKGPDYSWKSGQGPEPTELATKERIVANYLPGAPMVMYSPGFDEVTKNECAYGAKVGADALPLPTAGLYSPTDSGKGATLRKLISDSCADIVQGHKKLSDWDSVVQRWRNGGGETIRSEYEKQYADAHS